MKKILIIYATAGEGHKRAAFAIKNALGALNPADTEIKIIDALDYAPGLFKWSYPRTYIFMVTYIPTIWGFFYYCLDLKWLYPAIRIARRFINKKNTIAFEDFLLSFKPGIVITTHFLASEVVSSLKRRNRLKTKLITCVTDFRMHSFWFAEETDHFCVSFKETQDDLVKKWKFQAGKIKILGIPVHPKFYELKDKDEICNKLSLSRELFTVLITGGGFGVGPIMGLVKTLTKMDIGLQILVVCGHNANLRNQIDKLSTIACPPKPWRRRDHRPSSIVKTYGFIDYVDELMSVSDIGITKAGGLICSEALAKELPLIIISPIRGQESRNCRLLLKNGAAFRINRPWQAGKVIKKIYCDDNVLKQMKENIRRIKRENPAANIAKFVLENAD